MMAPSSILIISEWDLQMWMFPNMFPKEQKNNKETSYQQMASTHIKPSLGLYTTIGNNLSKEH
jgi:hypothetical protein